MTQRRISWTLVLIGALGSIVGCAADASDPSATRTGALVCEPGEQRTCGCPGGSLGAQVCRDDASGWEACFGCSEPAAGGAAGSAASDPGGPPAGGAAGQSGAVPEEPTGQGGDAAGGAAGAGGGPQCIAKGEPCVPTFPNMDDDPCCDEEDQGYHCCPVFHECVIDWWQ